MILSALCLDHFYLQFTPSELQELRAIGRGLRRCDYQEVTSGKAGWRGLYLSSNVGSYFEMLEASEPRKLGIAISPFHLQYVDPLALRKELPRLPWKTQTRFWKKSSTKVWFKAAGLAPRAGRQFRDEALCSWLMGYGQNHDPDATRQTQASIERFRTVVLRVGRDHVASFRHHARILPGKSRFTDRKIELEIPNRDGGNVVIDCRVERGSAWPSLVELIATPCPDVRSVMARTAHFETTSRRGAVVLRRR